MVLARTGVDHIRLGHLVSYTVTGQPVVDSPACIVDFRSLAALCPPSVLVRDIAVQVAEGIGEAFSQQVSEASALFVSKAW